MFDRPATLLTSTAVVVLLAWVTFTASPKLHELLVGVVATAVTTAFFANVLRTETLRLQPRFRDFAQIWRLPGDILKDSWLVIVVLFKDLAGIERAGSFYRLCGFRSSEHDPVLISRSALATAYATCSPNMIVIGIDPKQSHMIFHQIKRDEVPRLAQELGAQR
jgi:multisubunit Na+/H+ antiporter MnhE subunit